MQTYFKIGDTVECYVTSRKIKHIRRGKNIVIESLDNINVYDKDNLAFPINSIRFPDVTKTKRKKKYNKQQLILF